MNRARQLFENPSPGFLPAAQLATVVGLDDEEHRNRVKIRLLGADGVADQDGPIWARVAAPFAGSERGAFWLPDEGDEVLVVFIQKTREKFPAPKLPTAAGIATY